jgi:hypothetical protein
MLVPGEPSDVHADVFRAAPAAFDTPVNLERQHVAAESRAEILNAQPPAVPAARVAVRREVVLDVQQTPERRWLSCSGVTPARRSSR